MNVDKLNPGDVLYGVRRVGVGNTTMTEQSVYTVRIQDVHRDVDGSLLHAVVASGGRERTMPRSQLSRLKANPPEWVQGSWTRGGPYCHVCHSRRANGHREDCRHPRAVAARKRAGKSAVTG